MENKKKVLLSEYRGVGGKINDCKCFCVKDEELKFQNENINAKFAKVKNSLNLFIDENSLLRYKHKIQWFNRYKI